MGLTRVLLVANCVTDWQAKCQVRMLIWKDTLVDGIPRAQVCLRGRSYGVKYVAGIIRALEVLGEVSTHHDICRGGRWLEERRADDHVTVLAVCVAAQA